MSNTPHNLHDDFPEQAGMIHALKLADPHFARLMREYDEVNDKVHRAESRVDAMSGDNEATLRKERMRLKDEIARLLRG
jgi:uncharacterized protein